MGTPKELLRISSVKIDEIDVNRFGIVITGGKDELEGRRSVATRIVERGSYERCHHSRLNHRFLRLVIGEIVGKMTLKNSKQFVVRQLQELSQADGLWTFAAS